MSDGSDEKPIEPIGAQAPDQEPTSEYAQDTTAPAAPVIPAPSAGAPASRAKATIVRVVIGVAIAAGAIAFYVSRQKKHEPPPGPTTGAPAGASMAGSAGERVVPVQVVAAATQNLPIWLEGLGSVVAAQQVTVKPQVDGRLDKIAFIEGQTVQAKDLLAQIDPRPFIVKLHQAEGALARDRAQLTTAKANLARYEGLRAQNLVAQQQVDDLKGQVGQIDGTISIDLASVEDARLQLDYASVRAPIGGVIGVRLLDAGNLVRANTDGIVVITAIDPAAVVFTVPQDKLTAIAGALAKGKVTVEIFGRDDTQKLGTGTLLLIDNQVNQQTATLRLKAEVPNPDRALWPNAFVKARLLLEERTGALVIPAVAIQRGPQGTFVYVVGADDTVKMTPVVVALATGDRVVIASGITAGDRIVTEGQNQLRPGGKVSIAGGGRRGSGDERGSGSERSNGSTERGSGSNERGSASDERGSQRGGSNRGSARQP